MRILWLTIDRSNRVADLFDPLQRDVARLVPVDFVRRVLPPGMSAGRYCIEACRGNLKSSPMMNPSDANTYDFVVCDALSAFLDESWKAVDVPKVAYWGDNHGPMVEHYIGRAYREFGFSVFLNVFRDSMREFHPYLFEDPAVRAQWLPWGVDAEVFHPYPGGKTVGALLTGAINPGVYPWRTKIQRAMAGHPGFRQIRRPHENDPDDRYPVRAEYAELLSRAWVSFATSSKYGYVVSKFFEIPACRTLLMCDEPPELSALGFKPFKHYVPLREDEDIRATVDRVLKDPDLFKIAASGHRLVAEHHTSAHRAAQFVTILKEVQTCGC